MHLPAHVLSEAQKAAEERGMSVEDWMAEAVQDQASRDEGHREKAVRAPGPWVGWTEFRFYGTVLYKSPDGDEIIYSPPTNEPYRLTDGRRRWIARHVEDCLRTASGGPRTFGSAEAAKKALVAYKMSC